MRRKIIAANWKMNGSRALAQSLLTNLRSELAGADGGAEVVIIPPALFLGDAARLTAGTGWKLGMQNVAQWDSGAYTGEISAAMAADAGAQYVICGHSERRQLFGENDAVVAAKVHRVLAAGLTPILCVGETLAQRDSGEALDVVARQVRASLEGVSGEDVGRVVVAYEPVWAIGTGKTASSSDAQAVHGHLRGLLTELGAPGESMALLYGGSVKPDNAGDLFAQADIDGGLIGGASLDAKAFAAICCA